MGAPGLILNDRREPFVASRTKKLASFPATSHVWGVKPEVPFWTNGKAVPATQMVDRCINAALGRLFQDADSADALAELLLPDGKRRHVWARDVLSGAMIANIVQKAKRMALKRRRIGPGGLVPDDFARAADEELDTIARRIKDPGKAREILGERDLAIVRVETRRG